MKQIFVNLLLFSCLLSHSQDSTILKKGFDIGEYIKSTIGKQFGDFKITNPDKTVFSNSSLSEKVVFVNFWFASCAPCISELEGLNLLFDTLKNNDNFKFVSFTFDHDSTIQILKSKYNIKYNVYHIERSECYRLNFNMGFPSNFVLDKKGVVKYSKVGGQVTTAKSTKDIMTSIYPKILEQL